MEKLKNRYNLTLKALNKLKRNIGLLADKDPAVSQYYEQFRDSAIKSFEFSLDTLWKFIKEYLVDTQNISFDAPTPRRVFRECWAINLINENEFNRISKLIFDRNLTSHSYDEFTAEEISQNLSEHYTLMKSILDRIDTSKF